MSAVILSEAVAGDGPDREVVWLVDVRHPKGGTASPFGWGGVYEDEELAEDEAAALAGRLDLPLSDERGAPASEPRGFAPSRRNGGAA